MNNILRGNTRLLCAFLFLTLIFLSAPFASAQAAFRFASWSDAQDSGNYSSVTANKISALNPAFTIFNGDFSDDGVILTASSGDSMQWMANSFGNLFQKTFVVRGNHDNHYSNPADWQNFFTSYPEGQGTMADRVSRIGGRNYSFMSGQDNLTYSFDYDNSRFIMVDVPGSVSSLTSAEVTWIDQRLTDAETRPELVHAFIGFHGPLYCVSYHCSCAGQRASCQGSTGTSLISVINRHPIVTATFHGHEHNLGWTHLDSTRISTLTHPIEQFMTSTAGQSTYNQYAVFDANGVPYRFDYLESSIEDRAFGIIDVNGSNYTVSLYRESRSTPVWTQSFTKSGPGPTVTPGGPTNTPSPTNTPGPTRTPTPTPTITPTPLPGSTTTIIGTNATWKYLDNGSNQGTAWKEPAFADTSWAAGPAKLGYSSSNSGYATVVSYGPDAANKYITTYFRKSFNITNPTQYIALNLGLLRDDGAVVYLNGVEVFRDNMPTGTITYTTKASVTTDDGGVYYPSAIDPSLLVAGTNVIAVEVHQAGATSSDLSFNFQLNGTTATASITPTPTPPSGNGPAVWAEDAMTWVYKTDAAKNNPSITLYSAKREYEPFQIVVKAPTGGDLNNVNVAVSDLIGPNGAVISSVNNITLYREYYVHVANGSASSSGTNKPLGPGDYPDGLIPFTDPVTHQDLQGPLDAAPFNIPAGQNQPVFVDIFTPLDAPAGQYTGTATITTPQGNSTININFNVWNFTLPLVRSLHAYSQLDYSGTRDTLTNFETMLKNGFNPAYVDPSMQQTLKDNYGLDRVHIFHSSGSSYRHCDTISPAPNPSDVAAEAARQLPGLYLYTEYANEVWPCTTHFQDYLNWATALRAGGVHPHIVTYPVTTPAPGLLGTAPNYSDSAGDQWSVLPKHYDAAKQDIDLLISKGVEMWSYNPLTQDSYSPKQTIDYLPINSRIMHGFINQSLGFVGTKMWRIDYWTADPWNDKTRYNQETGSQAPGEGDIVYPGDNVGLANQILPGMRLKWYREGVEDYEYIQILKNMGQAQFAMDTVHTVATDFHVWSQDKNTLLNARIALGNKINEINNGQVGNGDANNDGRVDIQDILAVLLHYNLLFTLPVDQFADGLINSFDFAVVASHL